VLLDAELAFTGDLEAEQRLREIAGADDHDATDLCQIHLVLAQVAWRHERPDEALGHVDALLAATVLGTASALFRIAAAVIDLWIAGSGPTAAGGRARAVDTLRYTRADVHDRPLLGAWATAGAELAALRGDTGKARELWALANRTGANVSRFFPQGQGSRLEAALGNPENRELLLADAGRLAGASARDRIHTLMEDLLA
jgi:hypothetical protein